MKLPAKISYFSIVFVAVICSGMLVSAQTEPLTPQQNQQIISSCDLLKNNLNQLRVSDALLRVNMGQQYELIATKLMDRFNNRISSNNFKIDTLKSSSDKYKSYLDTFRSDYIKYEESLSATLRIDCKSQSGVFYSSLMTARYNRSKVYEDINNMNQQIDQYRLDVGQFEKFFQTLGGGK